MNEELAVSFILDDETLTEDLDDQLASKVISWAVSVSEKIVSEVEDEGACQRNLLFLRKMVRYMNDYYAEKENSDSVASLLDVFLLGAQIGIFETRISNEVLKQAIASDRQKGLEITLDHFKVE